MGQGVSSAWNTPFFCSLQVRCQHLSIIMEQMLIGVDLYKIILERWKKSEKKVKMFLLLEKSIIFAINNCKS